MIPVGKTRIGFAYGIGLDYWRAEDIKTGVLINELKITSPKPARAGQRWPIFFTGWTLFVLLAAWWLWHRVGSPINGTNWVVGGDVASGATHLDRLGNWLKLVDLNFHRIYPWILLAPYVALLGWRFPWGRHQWRVSLPVHVAGCALFAVTCYLVGEYADWWRPVSVIVSMQMVPESGGAQKPSGKSAQAKDLATSARDIQATNTVVKPSLGAGVAAGGSKRRNDWVARGDPHAYGRFPLPRGLVENPFDLLSLCVYAGLVAVADTVRVRYRSKEREKQAAALEAQLTTARLNVLTAQLHPHFLFNALNAISTLLVRDARAAREALASFSELLRLALCQSTQAEVTLGEDLEFLRRYVEIQQTRLGDRLRVEEVIPSEILNYLVPALLLQPLVENAIRHGIETSLKPGWVRVVVQRQGKLLKVIVEDNGTGLSSEQREDGESVGIGLKNLKARLETLYGPEYTLEFGPRPHQGGVMVSVKIPLRRTPVGQPDTAIR